jgi:hypothetical protein
MEIILAIAVLAVGIATLVIAVTFGKRTEKHVSAMLNRLRDTAVTNNEKAINDLRAELHEGLARLDQPNAGPLAAQESVSPPQAPGYQAGTAADTSSPADASSPDPWGDGQV